MSKTIMEMARKTKMPYDFVRQERNEKAITAVNEALAQPAQEPVAYCEIHYLPEPCAQCSKEHEGYNTPPAAQPAPVQEPIHQWRQRYSPYWYDGYPDHEDGGGPYETRILYATPPALTKENT